MFEGVQTTGEGCVSAWLTNTNDFQVHVDAGEAIAFWEADMDGEFELADSLTGEVELMVNALNAKRGLSKRILEEEHAQRQLDADATASSQTRRKPSRVVGSASVTQHRGDHADAVAVEVAAEATHSQQQATHMGGKVAEASCMTPSPETKAMNSTGKGVYNAEDYQWKDDHLSLELSRIPSQHPDPPVEATLEELKAAWSKTWNEITQERKWSDDHCAEINGKVRQLLRLNDRVRNIVLCEEEARELPSEMDFDKGYNHRTKEQRVYLKKKLAPEGSFFMKGK